MKSLSKKNKIIISIIALIIIVGIILTATIGLNYSLRYQESKRVELYIQKDFEISDIKQITDEVLPNQNVIIQKVEVFEDSVSITSKDITEEQRDKLVTKINEKYETELTSDIADIQTIPSTRGRDIVKPYVKPVVISTILILAYMAIRYYKLNSSKVVTKTVCALIVTQGLLLSILAIIRIPVGILTMPTSITIYIITLLGLTIKFEKELNNKNEKEVKKKK